jgi:hypothetical protein
MVAAETFEGFFKLFSLFKETVWMFGGIAATCPIQDKSALKFQVVFMDICVMLNEAGKECSTNTRVSLQCIKCWTIIIHKLSLSSYDALFPSKASI